MVYHQDPDRTVRVYRGRPATCLICWEVRSHCRAVYVRSYRDAEQTGRRDYVRLGWICPKCVGRLLDHQEEERELLEEAGAVP